MEFRLELASQFDQVTLLAGSVEEKFFNITVGDMAYVITNDNTFDDISGIDDSK